MGSITALLCHSFLLTLFNWSNMGPSHGLQSFTINMLQHALTTDWSTDICSRMIFFTGCSKISGLELQACPPPPCPFFFSHLDHYWFSHIWGFFPSLLSSHWLFFPFFTYVLVEVSPAWVLGPAMPCGGSVGASWN